MNRAVRYYAIQLLLMLAAGAAIIIRYLWVEGHRAV